MKNLFFVKDDIYEFLLSQDEITVSKIISSLEILKEFGEKLRPPKSKKIMKNVYELRILSNISVRVFYTFYMNDIWILHSFIKKSQKIPLKEIGVIVSRLNNLR
jgi:phage-related protein